jgi:hypothetical protein
LATIETEADIVLRMRLAVGEHIAAGDSCRLVFSPDSAAIVVVA